MIARFVFLGWLVAAAMIAGNAAQADTLKVLETAPADRAVLKDSISSDYFVRFDQPVDHIHSVFMIKRDGAVVSTLQPRFKTAPDVLFARAPTLRPGNYTFHWSVRTLAGTEVQEGEVSFAVASDAK